MQFFKKKKTKSFEDDAQAVCSAAALLGTSEYHLFQIAHIQWFGSPAAESALEQIFSQYIQTDVVPFWMRDLVRSIMQKSRRGELDATEYGFESRRPQTITPELDRSLLYVFAGAMVLFSILIFTIDWTIRIS